MHPSPIVPRRGVLRAGAVAFATIALGGCASLFAKKRAPDVTVAARNGEIRVPTSRAPWATGGGQGELVVAVEGRDDKILVFRDEAGRLAAVSMTCRHQGCDVDWVPAQGRIVCPCHGSQYGSDGAVLRGPTKLPLDAYPTRIEGDEIVIRIA